MVLLLLSLLLSTFPCVSKYFLGARHAHLCWSKKASSSTNAQLFFSNMLLKDPLCYIYSDVGFLTWGTPQVIMALDTKMEVS